MKDRPSYQITSNRKFALVKVACLLLLVWGAARFCHHQTKGFRLSKLQNNTTCFPQMSPPLPKEFHSVLNQKFRFFGRGLQSFSFLSEDGSTVLKLFNNRYQNRLFWLRFFPLSKKIFQTKRKWEKTFLSYQIAFDELREETGLLYYHPAKSSDCPKITLIDPIGIEHSLDLNQHGFVLQKKADLAYPFLSNCAKQQDFTKALEAFHSLFSLLTHKMKMGIADHDPLIRTNFGFCGNKAVQIDLGPLSYDDRLKAEEIQREELKKITLSLQHWLEEKHPELLPQYYEALQKY